MNTPKKNILLCLAAAIQLAACNNYGLDDKIRVALNGGNSAALALTAPAAQVVTIQNKNLILGTLQFSATGGKQPYNFNFTQANVPANIILSISAAGLVTLTRNTAISYPPNITPINILNAGTITVKVTDSSGTSAESSYPLSVQFKKVFVTSSVYSGDKNTWSTFGCSGANAMPRANCICQGHAQAANLLNASKYRAWISDGPAVPARCVVSNKPTPGTNEVSVLLISGGTGYAASFNVNFTAGTCTTYPTVQATSSGGIITSLNVTNPGNCTAPPTADFSPGGGTSATAQIQVNQRCNHTSADGGPWYNMGGLLIATDMGIVNGLLANAISNPISKNESGGTGPVDAWTASTPAGMDTGTNCSSWIGSTTGTSGNSTSALAAWTNGGAATCGAATAGFYCFETD